MPLAANHGHHSLSYWHRSTIITLLFCLIISGLIFFFLQHSYNAKLTEARMESAATSRLVSAWVKGSFEATDYLLHDMADLLTEEAFIYPPRDTAQVSARNQTLLKKMGIQPNAFMAVVINHEGIITHAPTAPVRQGTEVQSQSVRNTLHIFKERESVVTRQYQTAGGYTNVTHFRRIYYADSTKIGALGLGLNLAFFSQWLDEITPSEGQSITILDDSLNILARRPQATKDMAKKLKSSPELQEFLQSNLTSSTFQANSYADNSRRIISLQKVAGLPFVIMVGESEHTWIKEWWREFWGSMIILLLLWTLAILVLWNYRITLSQKENLFRNSLQLEQLNNELSTLAITDHLTGLYNRVKLDEALEHEIARCARSQAPFSVLMIDIDYFKRVNDEFGHAAGDAVLVTTAKIFRETARETDMVGRWGGEEFLVLCVDSHKEYARILAERLRAHVEAYPFNTVGQKTVSLGVSEYQPGDTPRTLLARADEALYRAKEQGRNQVQLG